MLLVLKKSLNSVQRGYYPIQRCLDFIQRCKRITTVKIRQFVIAKDYTPFVVAFVSDLKMTLVRGINTKQGAITERVQSLMASWFPVMGIPCTAGLGVTVPFRQPFTTVGTASSLSLPSLLYSVVRKSSHSGTSKKDGWSASWEKDVWVKTINGKPMNKLAIYKNTPWLRQTRTWYNVFYGREQVGRALSLAKAKEIGDAFFKKLKRA